LYRMAREQAEAAGMGAFKRPYSQLDLFGLPYIGGTPRPDAAEGQPPTQGRVSVTSIASAAAAAAGGTVGGRGGAPISHRSARAGGV
jgi:hypothetical protein